MPEEVIWYSLTAVVVGSCIVATIATHGLATPVFSLLVPLLKLVRDEIKEAKNARAQDTRSPPVALPAGAGAP